ncbi:Uncharacterised protein [Mycobacteroides abscessus subsp. abscessus]|nr:Uncharacterised protein [Mycobacteroides abscessus subsp. abscessus]
MVKNSLGSSGLGGVPIVKMSGFFATFVDGVMSSSAFDVRICASCKSA